MKEDDSALQFCITFVWTANVFQRKLEQGFQFTEKCDVLKASKQNTMAESVIIRTIQQLLHYTED